MADQVLDLRKRLRMNQEEFASALGYSRNYISQIELGNRDPGPRFVRELHTFEQLRTKSRVAEGEPGDASIRVMADAPGGPRARIKAVRLAKGISIPQLAKLTRYPATVIEQLENTGMHASEGLLEAISRELGIPKEELMAGSDSPAVRSESGMEATLGARPNLILPAGMKGRYVPLLSYAEAGAWGADHSDSLYDYTAIFALNVDDRKAFAIKVSGNSMEPNLRDGDMVICSPAQELHNGDAAVIRTRSENVYIKFWENRGEKVTLSSANTAYEPIHLPLAEIIGAWPVVQHIASGKVKKQL